MEMSKANQIQIGMLGVIIVLLILQLTGVGSSASSSSLRAQEKQNLLTPTNPSAATPSIAPSTPSAAPTPPPAQPAAPVGPTTVMSFDNEAFDFGTVTEGEVVEHTFNFKNTGSEPLTITNAKGSCGCTVPKWPKEPIPVGGSSDITVKFDSKGKAGKRNQTVTITANTEPANTIIRLTGEVLGNGAAADNNPIQIQAN